MKNVFSIGEVSSMFDVSIDTLRYYDRIELLCPEVNKKNNYRTYNLKDIYILSLILGARYLEISINDIKKFLRSDNLDFDIYLEFMNKQSELLNSKIKYLQKINLNLNKSKEIIGVASQHSNIYDFNKLTKNTDKKLFYMFPIKKLIAQNICKRFSKLIEIDNITLEYFTKFNIANNELYPQNNNIFIEKNIISTKIVNKLKQKNKIIIENIEIEEESILVDFLGTEEEIKKYIQLLIENLNKKNNYILIKTLTFFPSTNEEKSFVQIFFTL
ncbi:MAG: MerR family transcriptional regulator [Sarcina sp.]